MYNIFKKIINTGIVTEKIAPQDVNITLPQSQENIRKALGRALAIRHVDAGSCNGCELEMHALNNPFYNLEGLGIQFVASPRHADLLLVTGPVSRHMVVALQRTYDAMPHPKFVIALGDCACAKGMFGNTYATCAQVSDIIPINAVVPGCPPTPTAIMQTIGAVIGCF